MKQLRPTGSPWGNTSRSKNNIRKPEPPINASSTRMTIQPTGDIASRPPVHLKISISSNHHPLRQLLRERSTEQTPCAEPSLRLVPSESRSLHPQNPCHAGRSSRTVGRH